MKTLTLIALAATALTAQTISLDPQRWILSTNSKNYAKTANCGGALCFDFPTQGKKTVNYLITGMDVPASGVSVVISLRVLTSGEPVFNYAFEPTNTCIFPATVRAYFEANGDIWTDWTGDTFRWWSNPIAYVLADGSATLTIPLTPDQWSTVFSRQGNADAEALANFQASIVNMGNIGMTFGGGCFFGHGVNVSGGTAKFQLLDLRIQ